MGNDEIKITINFKDKKYNLTIKDNFTIREIIIQFMKDFLNSQYDISKFTLKINGINCEYDKKISHYENYIKDNYSFELFYDYEDIVEECYIKNQGKKIIPECYIKEEPKNDDQIIHECLKENKNIENFENNIQKNIIEENKKFIKKKKIEKKQNKEISKNENYENNNQKKFSDITINIKFFGINNKTSDKSLNANLYGLLKLCLLKEIAITSDYDKIYNVPEQLANIMEVLKNGKINYKNNQEGILKLLKQIDGSNIINFSKYVDNLIEQSDINKYLIQNLSSSKREIIYIYNYLGKYIEYTKIFEQEFERAKRESVFEFSIISATIIEREDLDEFEEYRNNCPYRKDRVLFHGTSYDSISSILTSMFKKAHCVQHGNGVYFTEDLDSCWIYGSEDMNKCVENNHRNLNIPKIDSPFSFIASAIYHDKYGSKRVINGDYTPKTNEINFAYAGMDHLETIEGNLDRTKFYGTEFVINDLHQILPFMSFKLKRDEYCIIWRDPNFSPNPVYNNEYDEIFKKFLKERMEYINQMAKFNIYPCETSEEALNLIKRKKYNKIILISNIGDDYGGKKFVLKARELIGNEVIALFSAYSIRHLDWVKKFKNAFFSNDPKFYEEFLDCFYGKRDKSETYNAIMKLKAKIENHYGVNFNFNNIFLDYPVAENPKIKKYSDLTFDL